MIRSLFVFGTRPEAIKLAPVIREMRARSDTYEVLVVVTAQHRQMLDQVLRLFDIVPDIDLAIMRPNQSLDMIVARAIEGLGEAMDRLKPDVVLVQGDTTTTFVGALAAFHRRIPVAHVEAGLRTWDPWSPFPEEINRQLTSRLAAVHFPPTSWSRDNLLREGIDPARVHITGNTVIDALLEITGREYLFTDPILATLPKKTILITAHRRESFGEPFRQMCLAMRAIAEMFPACALVYPVHLNPNVREPVFEILSGAANIHLVEPLDYEPFVHLMKKAHIILTDSGGVQEEAPSLGKPVLVMREKTERPEGIEAGTVRLVGNDGTKIVSEVSRLLDDADAYRAMAEAKNPYGDGRASKRIADIVPAYCK
ncbi:MAG: UDP-N-acetylglucosamine 2-epimerase (non-hydrolyzing) [Deltaproteobacteria bacterium]|nr:UDP-N-acetylglucosamine 2-epimerase (non-hydrolyzing) [Deltaproteobacteria bacterium]